MHAHHRDRLRHLARRIGEVGENRRARIAASGLQVVVEGLQTVRDGADPVDVEMLAVAVDAGSPTVAADRDRGVGGRGVVDQAEVGAARRSVGDPDHREVEAVVGGAGADPCRMHCPVGRRTSKLSSQWSRSAGRAYGHPVAALGRPPPGSCRRGCGRRSGSGRCRHRSRCRIGARGEGQLQPADRENGKNEVSGTPIRKPWWRAMKSSDLADRVGRGSSRR